MTDEAIYLDYAATTPLDERVMTAMMHGRYANPSSIHIAGRESAKAVATARKQLADLLGTDANRIIWTAGATESDNLAIQGAARFRANRGRHLVTMRTEHKAVTDTFAALSKEGFEISWLQPDSNGRLPLELLRNAIRDDTQLVSVMHVNNETGVIQDICGIGEICRQSDVLFHTDAAQSVGKLPINLADLPVDLLSMTAHKLCGPQGIGALYIADAAGCELLPIMFGGGQEKKLRPGTLPVQLIVGAGKAAELAAAEMQENHNHVVALNERLQAGLKKIPGISRNGCAENAYPGIVNVSVDGLEGESLMLALEPICVSSGSACNSTRGEPSSVLRALGRDEWQAQSAIRFSFGRQTTFEEIDAAVERLQWAISHLRKIAMVADNT